MKKAHIIISKNTGTFFTSWNFAGDKPLFSNLEEGVRPAMFFDIESPVMIGNFDQIAKFDPSVEYLNVEISW